jgi:hypothetical protein
MFERDHITVKTDKNAGDELPSACAIARPSSSLFPLPCILFLPPVLVAVGRVVCSHTALGIGSVPRVE